MNSSLQQEINNNIDNEISDNIENEVSSNKPEDFAHYFKVEYRFFRKKFTAFCRNKKKKNFTTILYITTNEPPIDFINAIRKQYPDKIIKVLTPIKNFYSFKKLKIKIDFFAQNETHTATLFKKKLKDSNIEIYGIYSQFFHKFDYSKFEFLTAYTKLSRIFINMIKPDIVHADKIPLCLGYEFNKKDKIRTKILQTVDDFREYENHKKEPFWVAINMVNKKSMQKICRDKFIKKYVAELFNIHANKKFSKLRDCIEYIYNHYSEFRKVIGKKDDNPENIIFNKLNARILELFPDMQQYEDTNYNIMYSSIQKCNFWAVSSKSYYNEIFEKPNITGKMFSLLNQTQNKSSYLESRYETVYPKESDIQEPFNISNFRENRQINKQYLIKEFSKERIKTRFYDSRLFNDDNYLIKGYFDSFNDVPLFFCNFDKDFWGEGVDIALTTILKLFDLYKNIKIIVSIPNGLKNKKVKNWVEFLDHNSNFLGQWVFIDGEVNLEQFYAGSDFTFFPNRNNSGTIKHFISLKFGCIPIVSPTGFLNDTISDIFDDISNGCGFKAKPDSENNENELINFCDATLRALSLYIKNPSSWNLLIKNAMNFDSSWNFEIIEKYNKIYDLLLK